MANLIKNLTLPDVLIAVPDIGKQKDKAEKFLCLVLYFHY